MTMACLGWGSLIWQPKELPVSEADWLTDGPVLPVEFARHSGQDRITLVLMRGGPAGPVCWCPFPFTTLGAAASALRKREGTKREWLGHWPAVAGTNYLHSDVIGEWARSKGLQGVVWTAIPPKWNDLDGQAPSRDEAIEHPRARA